MNTRWWALAALMWAACDGGGDGTGAEACADPPAVNTVCATIESYGTADFRVREAVENAVRSGVESDGGQRDGLNLALAEATPGEIAEGIFNCGEQEVHIDFRENAGSSEETAWREDAGADGPCFIRVDQGGVLGEAVVQGAFAATLRAGEDQLRSIEGTFHVGARSAE